MDGDRSGLRLMFPWERVLPIPCPSSGVLLGNATWAKETPIPFLPEISVQVTQHNTWPQGRQDCFSKVRLQVRDLGNPNPGPKQHEHTYLYPLGCSSHPRPLLVPQELQNGEIPRLPTSLVCGGIVSASQQAGPQHIRHMQY